MFVFLTTYGFALVDRHVRQGYVVLAVGDGDVERRFEVRFVEAWEGFASFNRFELRRGKVPESTKPLKDM